MIVFARLEIEFVASSRLLKNGVGFVCSTRIRETCPEEDEDVV